MDTFYLFDQIYVEHLSKINKTKERQGIPFAGCILHGGAIRVVAPAIRLTTQFSHVHMITVVLLERVSFCVP